jgi:hypothetical protein
MITLVEGVSVKSTSREFSGPRMTCHPTWRANKTVKATLAGSDILSASAVKGPCETERQREFTLAAIILPGSFGFGPQSSVARGAVAEESAQPDKNVANTAGGNSWMTFMRAY